MDLKILKEKIESVDEDLKISLKKSQGSVFNSLIYIFAGIILIQLRVLIKVIEKHHVEAINSISSELELIYAVLFFVGIILMSYGLLKNKRYCRYRSKNRNKGF